MQSISKVKLKSIQSNVDLQHGVLQFNLGRLSVSAITTAPLATMQDKDSINNEGFFFILKAFISFCKDFNFVKAIGTGTGNVVFWVRQIDSTAWLVF